MCRIICLLKQTYKIVWKMLGFERYNSVGKHNLYHLKTARQILAAKYFPVGGAL
jgi:hypothetical protein